MNIVEDIDFVMANIAQLAEIADKNFIDPLVRPKSERKLWSRESYTEDVLEGLKWWKEQPDWMQKKYLHSLRDYHLQAIAHEFPEQRVRWIYTIAVAHPNEKLEKEDAEKRELKARLRAEQAKMDPADNKYCCLRCGKFVYMYDRKNNKIHDKEEVCDAEKCGGVRPLQRARDDEISTYRKSLSDRKKFAEEKKRRVPQR